MTINSFLWGMRFVTVLAVAATLSLLFLTAPYVDQDPGQKLLVNIILLNICLLLSLTGIFTLFLFFLRRKATGNEVVGAHLGISFRQGIFLGLAVVMLLVLQSLRILTWWDGLLAVGAVMMVELYFLAR